MKFGGTSMGSAERIRVAATLIAKERQTRPVAVVVSAMSKVTDLLLETMRRAELGDRAVVEANLQSLLTLHLHTGEQLLGSQFGIVSAEITALVGEFRRIVNGVTM